MNVNSVFINSGLPRTAHTPVLKSELLPMRPGRPQRWSHDYYRHGTTSLFAALDVATGRVIGATKSRHRSQEFVSFLRQIEREIASDLDVHLILDNYATHKTAEVARWLKSRPRWHLHFIPTHSSWLNQVEHFFAQITTCRIRRGCFRSVADCAKPSPTTSLTIMPILSPSGGRLPPTQSWKRSLTYVM